MKGICHFRAFIAVFGSELRCMNWRRLIGDDVFVVGHDLLLDQKFVYGLWLGPRIAEGRTGFRELGWATPEAQVP